LGKTVITLALILTNPAPDLPASDSPISELDSLEDTAWDKDLHARTQKESDANPERGSIISRGTLVVCHVSLVGQWIEEAKSKLKDPGLIYP
jgi:SNF2 family DNA or RNA helicase